MNIPNRKLPNTDKFKDFSPMPMLGLGTIWLGRRWPVDNKNYKQPARKEIHAHLDFAYDSGIRMFDSAAAYGHSEEKLGEWIRTEKAKADKLFVATKWGENFDVSTETSITDHSIENLRRSFNRSLEHLSKIDLLYIHKANELVFGNAQIRKEMISYVKDGKVKYLGVSVSDAITLDSLVNSNDIWFDFLQTSADVLMNRPDLTEKMFKSGGAVVINSPIRKSRSQSSPEESYLSVAKHPFISFVLTGTRNHLSETVGYFKN